MAWIHVRHTVADYDTWKAVYDQTATLKLSSAGSSVVIGNATIADVAAPDATTLLVTGKAFGKTNLTVLDRMGKTIYSNEILVGGTTKRIA